MELQEKKFSFNEKFRIFNVCFFNFLQDVSMIKGFKRRAQAFIET